MGSLASRRATRSPTSSSSAAPVAREASPDAIEVASHAKSCDVHISVDQGIDDPRVGREHFVADQLSVLGRELLQLEQPRDTDEDEGDKLERAVSSDRGECAMQVVHRVREVLVGRLALALQRGAEASRGLVVDPSCGEADEDELEPSAKVGYLGDADAAPGEVNGDDVIDVKRRTSSNIPSSWPCASRSTPASSDVRTSSPAPTAGSHRS